MKVETGLKPRARSAGDLITEVGLPKHRHLPHIDLVGHYQFITFRTFDSVDDFVKKLSSSAQSNAKKQLAVDAYLDQSPRGAYLSGEVLDFLSAFLKSKDGVLYALVAFAIMSNHVHLLIKPMAELSHVMQAIKGASAKAINTMLGKTGKFWADDYYDKLIRDEQHFAVVYEYIKNNPLKIQNGNRDFSPAGVVDDVFGAEAPIPKRFYGKFEIKESL